MLTRVLAGVIGAGFILSAAPAFAGEWKFNPRACPDLVEDHYDRREDRRDSRVDYGRRDRQEDRYDRRENRRDERVTVCPISSFYYVPDRREAKKWEHSRGRGHGYAYGRKNLRPPLKYDRRARMYYRYSDGRKIFVRG